MRHPSSIIGNFIKDKDLELMTIAKQDPFVEEKLRRKSWYDYNFHILALKRKNDSLKSENHSNTNWA